MAREYQDKGEIAHRGWDIPTRYGRDTTGLWWRDSAHGGELDILSNAEELIALAQEEGDEDQARMLAVKAGLEDSYEPGWMKQARAAGWRPPE